MEGAALLYLLIPIFFGAMFLILYAGFRSIEDERAREEAEANEIGEEFIPIPRFFARLGPAELRDVPDPVEESVLLEVQRYLMIEQTLADEFVSEPSVERLFRKAGGERRRF